ncbi:MAG: hypothetical protein A2902_03150 [Elusimicrobia bacterium RIFCSPLOWO2_01_FULL_64_13]|nr:MAG: hypothetical protein A2902_03150 [Elusimicrobia bacterium RIFCSPLOWO2_01_FULL_64_13]
MADKPTVLIIEDEPNIRSLIETVLSKNGYVTVGADSAESGLKKIPNLKPALILLDIQLPNMDGLECCRKIREDPRSKDIPLILVSVQSSDIHKIIGLESGADDFITKPFNPGELLARVNAVLRRSRQAESAPVPPQLSDGFFVLDLDNHEAALKGRKLKLTPKEFTLLVFFLKSREKVISRDVMSTHIWERENLDTSRTIDVHIGRLRKKLGKYHWVIQTVGKVGYRYSPEGEKS